MHYFRQPGATWMRCLLFLLCAAGFSHTASAGTLLISGQIIDASGKPLDGCLVSIASAAQKLRSRGVLTEEGGTFSVPFASNYAGQSQSVPYLEIYWDEQLIFRQPLTSLEIANASQFPSAQFWNERLEYGGEIKLSPIKVSRHAIAP
jgi:hypothetical protein